MHHLKRIWRGLNENALCPSFLGLHWVPINVKVTCSSERQGHSEETGGHHRCWGRTPNRAISASPRLLHWSWALKPARGQRREAQIDSSADALQLGKLPLGDENINYVLHLLLIRSSSVKGDHFHVWHYWSLGVRYSGRKPPPVKEWTKIKMGSEKLGWGFIISSLWSSSVKICFSAWRRDTCVTTCHQ